MTAALCAGFILALAVAAEACDERYQQNCEVAPAPAAPDTEPAAVPPAPAAQSARPSSRRAARPERRRDAGAAGRREAVRGDGARRDVGPGERRAVGDTDAAAAPAAAVAPVARPSAPAPTRDSAPAPTRESALERRFRGFIDPRTMAENMFESLRPARVDGSHMALAALPFAAPLAAVASASPDTSAAATAIPVPPTVTTAESAPVVAVEAEPLRRAPSDSSADATTMRGLALALGAALATAAVVGLVARA